MPISIASSTVPRWSGKPCEETEPCRSAKRAERITAMTKSRPPSPAGLPLLGSVFPWLLSSGRQSPTHRARGIRVERVCVSRGRYHHVLPLRQPSHPGTVLRAGGLPTQALRPQFRVKIRTLLSPLRICGPDGNSSPYLSFRHVHRSPHVLPWQRLH
jgi:hypothetical protein